MEIGALTDIGKIRKNNQDSIYYPNDLENDIPIFIVADGMGGHNAGEVASSEALHIFLNHFKEKYNDNSQDKKKVVKHLSESIIYANRVVFQKANQMKEYEGMGTTFTAMLKYQDRAILAHIGDSRVYVVRRNRIYQLTRDHTYVSDLCMSGSITREEAKFHPQKNLLTKALGSEIYIEPDIYIRKFFDSDTFIICSDGLTNFIKEQEILDEASRIENCQELANRLVFLANEAGGLDNISVIVVRSK